MGYTVVISEGVAVSVDGGVSPVVHLDRSAIWKQKFDNICIDSVHLYIYIHVLLPYSQEGNDYIMLYYDPMFCNCCMEGS